MRLSPISFRYICMKLYPTSPLYVINYFSHRDVVVSLGNLNWPSTEGGENFLNLDNIFLWPAAEARP